MSKSTLSDLIFCWLKWNTQTTLYNTRILYVGQQCWNSVQYMAHRTHLNAKYFDGLIIGIEWVIKHWYLALGSMAHWDLKLLVMTPKTWTLTSDIFIEITTYFFSAWNINFFLIWRITTSILIWNVCSMNRMHCLRECQEMLWIKSWQTWWTFYPLCFPELFQCEHRRWRSSKPR